MTLAPCPPLFKSPRDPRRHPPGGSIPLRLGSALQRVPLALVAAAATSVLLIELLGGLAGLLSQATFLIIAAASISAFVLVARGHGGQASAAAPSTSSAPPRSLPGTTPGERAMLIAIAAVLVTALLIAIAAPPNTWDSMTYHLPRVAHWWTRGSVAHYPTAIDRQLWQPPVAEYLTLVLYGGTGGRDRLAALPQWIAGAGALIACAGLARTLGGGRTTLLTAVVLAATLPGFILQASSTQNDLVLALWIVVLAGLALRHQVEPAAGLAPPIALGAALGLALGTKGTALPLAAPWVLLFFLADWRAERSPRRVASRAAVAMAVAVLLNAGHWIRNLETFDHPLGPSSVQRMLRPAGVGPAVVASNAVSNLSLHAGTPWTQANQRLERGLVRLHEMAGTSVDELYPFFGKFRIVPWSTHEDIASSPLFLVLGLAGAVVAVRRWPRMSAAGRAALLGLAGSAILFALMVRWQPFNARLHLPLLLLAAPLAAMLLGRTARLRVGVLVVAGILAVPAVLGNQLRPLVPALQGAPEPDAVTILAQPREAGYFNARPQLHAVYREIARRVSPTRCAEAGLIAGYDSWEYPLWVLLRPGGVRLAHGVVTGCPVIGLDQRPDWEGPSGYEPVWRKDGYSVWVPIGP